MLGFPVAEQLWPLGIIKIAHRPTAMGGRALCCIAKGVYEGTKHLSIEE